MHVKRLAPPVEVEPPRSGENPAECVACNTPDDAYIWVSERWRVRAMDRPTGLPMVLILECRSHLDLGDLPNLLAAELGVMTVRLERAIRSLDDVARVHVNRWGDGSAHLHMWFLARPYGRLQLRGTFLSLWDDILPVIPELQWRENLALVAAWLAEFGGSANAEPPHIQWQSPSTISESPLAFLIETQVEPVTDPAAGADAPSGSDRTIGRTGETLVGSDSGWEDDPSAGPGRNARPTDLGDVEGSIPVIDAETPNAGRAIVGMGEATPGNADAKRRSVAGAGDHHVERDSESAPDDGRAQMTGRSSRSGASDERADGNRNTSVPESEGSEGSASGTSAAGVIAQRATASTPHAGGGSASRETQPSARP